MCYKNKIYFFFYFLTILPATSFALTFSIVPERDLPTYVPEFGSVAAYYIIKNTTDQILNNNFVQSLPKQVTQTTCQPNYCGKTFNLGPAGSSNDSCILKLTVKGADNDTLNHPLKVCTENETNCDGTDFPLQLTEDAPAPLFSISIGSYTNKEGRYFPLLLATNNNGTDWKYPTTIFDNLTTSIDPDFGGGAFRAAGCSGTLDKSLCIAAGFYCRGSNCTDELPLIALGRNDIQTWFYPHSVYEDLKSRIDPNFTSGSLSGASCSGYGSNALCIASGAYLTPSIQSPLLAVSTNGGFSWSYPSAIFQNLKSVIDPTYSSGFLSSTACNQSVCEEDNVCIATGGFCSGELCEMQLPLIASSKDRGKNWTYPPSVFQDLKTKIDPNFSSGELRRASCTDAGNKAVCVAAGWYFNSATVLPLLAVSFDRGTNWSYPSEIFTDLATKINSQINSAYFNSTACTGSGLTARCIAAGFFTSQSGASKPLIALTKDGGHTWTYPPFVHTKLKTQVDANAVSGAFNGASCIDNANKSICVAAGYYCHDKFCATSYPLLALTLDGGKAWQYPSSVYTDLTSTIDPNFVRGFFNDVHCSGRNADEGSEGYSLCVASGEYSTNDATLPLAAYSTDNGLTWFYPPYVSHDLTTSISPDFSLGYLDKSGSGGEKFNKSIFHKNFKP